MFVFFKDLNAGLKLTHWPAKNQLDVIEFWTGERQGWILSPIISNIYSEELFRRALEDVLEGMISNGVIIHTIRYYNR